MLNKLPDIIKRSENIQEFERRRVFFTAAHYLLTGLIYVPLGCPITQLFIIMYILFLILTFYQTGY
jgi:hypothetical protein